MQGIIIKSTGSWYQVRAADQSVWQCRVKGKFRLDNLKLTNPVAVGDSVTIAPEAEQDHKGIITAIAPRTNYVARQSPSQSNK